jgi:hypothetical protein
VRHFDTWWGEEVDVDFRFLEAGPVPARLERAGFGIEATLDHAPYEVVTRRTYILARRAAGRGSSPG